MACVSEAIGLALPYSAGTPAPYEKRDKYAVESGKMVMNLLRKKIRPRDIVTKKSLENAAAIVAATGGSTNAALHLPAIANEIGIKFDLMDVARIFRKTPYLANLKPGGLYVAKDLWKAGGIPMLLKTMLDGGYIHGDCLTVTGKTMRENLKNVKFNFFNPAIFTIAPWGDKFPLRPTTPPSFERGFLWFLITFCLLLMLQGRMA